MSIDENSNETETQAQPETSDQGVSAETVTQAADSAKNAVGGAIASLLALKESNPKVFFGGIGGIALILIILMASGGSESKLPVHQAKPIAAGQSYVLKSPNTYDPNATIRMVAVPGSMAAYDDTEEADREGSCKHMPQNTPVKLIQSQDDFGKKDVWAEVEFTGSGECQGKKAWTLSINLQ